MYTLQEVCLFLLRGQKCSVNELRWRNCWLYSFVLHGRTVYSLPGKCVCISFQFFNNIESKTFYIIFSVNIVTYDIMLQDY
jgi:hypothetical protein